MSIKQISIFVENKQGRLAEITGLLSDNNININALSIADTADYGILRLIVSDTNKAYEALKKENITVSVTDVLAVAIDDVPGGFSKAVKALSDEGIGVEYAYAFITSQEGKAYVIFRVEENEPAVKVLEKAGFALFNQEDLF